MTRRFRLEANTTQRAGIALMDIPHLALLRYSDADALMAEFQKSWGVRPNGVVLPVTAPDGLLFEVAGLSEHQSQYALISERLRGFEDIVTVFASKGLDVYLLITPALHFINSDTLHLSDISSESSKQMCVCNPKSQEIIAAILGTAYDIALAATRNTTGKVKGVVLDMVDVFPMGAKNGRMTLTCFCPNCLRYFDEYQPGLIRAFKTFPNPWNLLLKDVGSGISFASGFSLKQQPEEIVGLSRQAGFDEIFSNTTQGDLLAQAQLLIRYLRARHDQTLSAVNAIFEEALNNLDQKPSRVLLLEGSAYAWTSGLALDRLERDQTNPALMPYDELWFNPEAADLETVPFRAYMWSRSRYYIDALLDLAASATNLDDRTKTGLARLSIEEVRNLLRVRLNQALSGAQTGLTSLSALPDSSRRLGIVGVALTREVGEKLIDGLRIPEGITAPRLSRASMPDQLLQRMLAMQQQPDEE